MRRISFVVGLLLLWSAPAWAQPARVQFVSATDQTGTALASLQSGAFTPTAGNTLLTWVSYYRNGGAQATLSGSDLAGNTWNCTSIPQKDVGAGGINTLTEAACYTHNISGTLTNDKVTISFSPSKPFLTIIPIEYSATGTSDPLDTTAVGAASATNSVTSAAFTTTTAHEVISCGMTAQNAQTWTAGSIGGTGSSLVTSVSSSPAGAEDLAVTSIQSGITAAATIGGSTDLSIVCATLTAGGGGASGKAVPTPPCVLLGVGCDDQPAAVRRWPW